MDTFRPLQGRDAYPAVRGFVYQVDRTLLAWLDLPEDAVLECEAGEDIDEIRRVLAGNDSPTEQQRTLEQVKYRAEPLTLRSPVVVESLTNFAATRRKNQGLDLRFRFFTNAATAKERGVRLPGGATGIDTWNAIRADTIAREDLPAALAGLRAILQGDAETPPSAAVLLVPTADEAFRADLIMRFEFSMGNESATEQRMTVRHRLLEAGHAATEDEAERLYDRLFVTIFQLLSRPGAKRLDRGGLRAALERATVSPADQELLGRLRPYFADISTRIATVQDGVTSLAVDVKAIQDQLRSDEFHSGIAIAVRDTLRPSSSGNATPYPDGPASPGFPLDRAITDAARNTGAGQPDRAIILLEQIRRERRSELDARARYRIQANLGHAYAAQHKLDLAADLYAAAFAEQPDDFDAQQLRILGLLHRGLHEEAHALVEVLRREAPEDATIAAFWITSAPAAAQLDALIGTLPATLREQAEVALAIARRASRVGDLENAVRWSRIAFSAAPGWEGAREYLAVALLERALPAWRASGGNELDGDQLAATREARDLLDLTLAQLPLGTAPAARAQRHLNLATAETILGRVAEADPHILAAYQLLPRDPDIALRYARWRAEHEQLDTAIAALAELPAGLAGLEHLTLQAHYRMRRDVPGDRDAAAALLERGRPLLGDAPPGLRASWFEIFVDLLAGDGRYGDARNLIDELGAELIPPIPRHVAAARLLRQIGDPTGVATEARAALDAVDDATTPFDRRGVAYLAESLAWWGDALPHWRALAEGQPPGDATYHLLACAQKVGADDIVLETCRRLRGEGFWDPRCLDAEIRVLAGYHDWDVAVTLLERALAVTEDAALLAHFRINLALLARKAGRADLADTQLPHLPAAGEVDADMGRRAVEALRLGPEPHIAIGYAYDLWRRFPDDAASWDALVAAFNLVDGPSVELAGAGVGAPGMAVALRDGQTGELSEWIIEDGAGPRRGHRELAPDDPIAQALMGHAVGDTVAITERRQLRAYTIQEVLPKAVYRWRWCLAHFEEYFPDKAYVWMIEVPEEAAGPGDFGELNAMLFEARSRRERLVEAYQNEPMSLDTLAEGLGRTVIETVASLAAQPELRMRSWPDDGGGLQEAFAAARAPGAIVLDLSALGTIFALDAIDLLGALPGPWIVARSTLELVSRRVQQEERSNGEAGTLVATPLGPLALDADEDALARRRVRWQALLAALEQHATIEPGSVLATLPTSRRADLIALFGLSGAASIALARQPGRVLWTDDWAMTVIGRQEYGVATAWTQPVLAGFVARERLERDRYSDLVLRLAVGNYTWTVLETADVTLALRQAAWDVDRPPLAAALDWLGSNVLTPAGTCLLVGPLLVTIWREAPTDQHAARATRRICDRIRSRSDGVIILTALHRNLPSFFQLDALREVRAGKVIAEYLQTEPPGIWRPA